MANYNVGVTLSAEDVESILLEHVRKATGLDVKTVQIKTKSVQKGNQRDSWTETVFEGAVIGGCTKTPAEFYAGGTNSLAAQIAAVESQSSQYGDH